MSWERTGLILGVLLALVTLIAKLKWIIKKIASFFAWLGWKLIWLLIHSDSDKSREALDKLLEPERTAMRDRFDALESQLKAARYDTGQVGGRVVELEGRIQAMRTDMAKERSEFRGDLAVATTRLETAVRDLRNAMDRTSERTNEELHTVKEGLHTVIGIVGGTAALTQLSRRGNGEPTDADTR